MKNILIIFAAIILLGSSCTKDFLSVDETNPNQASSVPASLVLPAALKVTGDIMNTPGNFEYVYEWYGLWSINSTYSQPNDQKQYNMRNSSYAGDWDNFYINAKNYDYIEKLTAGDPLQVKFYGIAKIMKAYIFQNIVDIYGDCPYSEAFTIGILRPKYDAQQTIYEDLITQIDAAVAAIKSATADAADPGSNDVMYQGDMTKWVKFANTLKLRILMHQADMTGRDAYITSNLANTAADGFIGMGEGGLVNPGYVQSAGKMNPFWARFINADGTYAADGIQYYAPGQDACDFYVSIGDPRGIRFFSLSSSGKLAGNYFGTLVLSSPSDIGKIGPGLLSAFNQSAPLLTDFESLFLQAEAAERGFISGDPKTFYKEALYASMSYMGVDDATAQATIESTWSGNVNADYDSAPLNGKLKLIITMKWASLNGIAPVEIWTDFRRTGYPDFIHWSQDPNRINNTPPVRMLYPQREYEVNGDNVKAVESAVPGGKVNLFTTKIFWQPTSK